MRKRLFVVCFALIVLRFPDKAYAQFTDPRNYDNTPVGINEIDLEYAYARSNASVDTSLVVAGATLSLNAGTIDYTRYFSFIHRLAWVEATVPLAGLGGSVTGTNIHGSSTGAGDSSYQFAVLLKGGPALSVAQFDKLQADHHPGCEPHHYRAHRPIQRRQAAKPWFESLVVQAGIRCLASLRTGTEVGVRRLRQRLFLHRQHFVSRNGNPPATGASRTRRTHQLFVHQQPLGLGRYALLVPRRYLR